MPEPQVRLVSSMPSFLKFIFHAHFFMDCERIGIQLAGDRPNSKGSGGTRLRARTNDSSKHFYISGKGEIRGMQTLLPD